MALFILAARILGAQTFGRYSYAVSVASLALIGMDLGLNTLFVREGAKRPLEVPTFAGTLLLIKCLLATVMLGAVWLFCRLMELPPPDLALVMAVSLIQTLAGLTELGLAGLNALERMDREALTKISARGVGLFAAGTLLLFGGGLWGLVAGLFAANLMAASMSLCFLYSHGGFRLRLNSSFLGRLLRESLPLALTNIFILVYFRVDMVMLESMGWPYEELGWYGAGVRIIEAVGLVPALVSASLLPVLSSLASGQPAEMAKLFSQGRRLLVILGLPAAVGLFGVRAEVPLLIFGPDFGETSRAFFWLGPMVAFLFINFLQLAFLTSMGLQRLCAWATGVCLAVNVGLNLLLIPWYGFEGAAAATLATEIVLFGQAAWFIYRHLGGTRLGHSLLRPALATLVMSAWLYISASWNLAYSIPSAMAVYGAALILVKGLTWPELKELVQIIIKPGPGVASKEA